MIALWAGLAFAAEGVTDRVAAVVNDEVITLSELYELGRPFVESGCPQGGATCIWEAETEVLDTLVEWALVGQELTRLDLTIGGADVDQAIDRVVAEYQMVDRDALRAEIERSGTTWEQYRDQIRKQLESQRFDQAVLLPRVSVTEDDLKDLYQRTARREKRPVARLDALGMTILPEEVDAQRAELGTVVEQLRAGTLAWAEAAQRFDLAGISDVLSGRDWEPGQLVGELDRIAFSHDVGTVVGPIDVGSMLAVVQIVARESTEGDILSYEEAEPALRREVTERKLEDVREEWVQRARRQAAVRILLTAP